jgi:hypothetical protein
VEASSIEERTLKNDLSLPMKHSNYVIPDDDESTHVATIQIQTVTDAEMQEALLAATGSDVPPPQRPGVTFLWSGSTPSKPVALLIDAPEALLRTRTVPVEVATPSPDGDVIQHFRTGQQLFLEVAETGTDVADRLVYATGGCRLLIFLKEAATGPMRLVLRQYRHTLFIDDPVTRDFTLVEMTLPSRAPWEA